MLKSKQIFHSFRTFVINLESDIKYNTNVYQFIS